MDPTRMSMTLVLLLGLGGIGGAVRACSSASRASGSAARVSSKAFRVSPKVRFNAPTRVIRSPNARVGGAAVVGASASDDLARAGVGRGAAGVGDDVVGSARGKGGKIGDQATNGADLLGGDDDD